MSGTQSNMTPEKYAMMRNQFVEWDKYLLDNTWASAAASTTIPENCIAIYHVLNPALKQIVDTLYVVSWSTQYNQDFKELSLAWVQESFEVEESDIKQVETPEESILQPGGQIFFLLDQNKHMVGTIAMMISDHGECELGKLTVKKEYNGKGYAHPLMREGIAWAREKKQPNILLLCNTKLEKAITLYKGYGFETIHLGPHPDYARCNIVMKLTL